MTRTLTVPTAKVLTAVFANKDLLEMEQFVKVLINFQRKLSWPLSVIYRSFCCFNILQVSLYHSVIPLHLNNLRNLFVLKAIVLKFFRFKVPYRTRFIGPLTVFHSTLSIGPIESVSVKYPNSQLTNQEPCPHILRYVVTVLIWLGYHYHSHLYGLPNRTFWYTSVAFLARFLSLRAF